jgi:uncharacterized membrane protein (UPF0127 family)
VGKRLASAVLALLIFVVPVTAFAQGRELLSLSIAKSSTRVHAFGVLDPRGSSDRVVLKLFRYDETGWALRRRDSAPLDKGGSYETSFRRPRSGTCKVTARYRDGGTIVPAKDVFPCAIPDFARGTADLGTPPSIQIDVLIADDGEERAHGLMYRRSLRDDLGMVFRWDQDQDTGFWMKNTLIPLSIAFYDVNGVILRIMDMDPCDEEPCPTYNPGVMYRGALEVKQGSFETWGIDEGDRITVSE